MALWDWRRRLTELYAGVRAEPDPETAWLAWRRSRDDLFHRHAQSPIEFEDRPGFRGLPFLPYDPSLRFLVTVALIEEPVADFDAGHDGQLRMRPFGRTQGLAGPLGRELTLFWILGYGGGVFLPFADATSGGETYGAGRYLLDTIKGADLGQDPAGRLVLDFNFAYTRRVPTRRGTFAPLLLPRTDWRCRFARENRSRRKSLDGRGSDSTIVLGRDVRLSS